MLSEPDSQYDAVVVGGGLAGISCALELHQQGMRFLLLEASDRLGGRVRTDTYQGYQLDHGFQVMLTAYPQLQELLDYDSLELGLFESGAYLWTGESLEIVADPFRHPSLIFKSLLSSAGTFSDKLRIASLRNQLTRSKLDDIFAKPEHATYDELLRRGFSTNIVESFIAPFYRGIFLDPKLRTSSRMFDFVFKCFSEGEAALPRKGMGEIPRQLAALLPTDSIRLNQPVTKVSKHIVCTRSGQNFHAKHVILAVDMTTASFLSSNVRDRGWRGTRCVYFDMAESPLPHKMIALNASQRGCIQNLCVPSDVSADYAPKGRSLLCVSTIDSDHITPHQIIEELTQWFGQVAYSYRFLKSMHIPHSLPRQETGDLPFENATLRDQQGIWLCGDHQHSSSLQGAIRSGRKVAHAIRELSS